MNLTGETRELIYKALLNAFPDHSDLEQMLSFKLNYNLNEFKGSKYKETIFNLIKEVESNDGIIELIQAALKSKPKNKYLVSLAEQFDLRPKISSNLEAVIRSSNNFFDIELWMGKLEAIKRQVCRIEAHTSFGTGFLIGPNLVLTNYHVLEEIIKNETLSNLVNFRFDFKMQMDGIKVNEGIVYTLDKDWLIKFSPPDLLDYALVKLKGFPGNENLIDQGTRAWIHLPLPDADLSESYSNGNPLFIVQHPEGEPIKLAFDTEAVIGLTNDRKRLRYKTNTLPGSSGSPCFNQNWDLIALHHWGNKGVENRGIPIGLIANEIGEYTSALEQQKTSDIDSFIMESILKKQYTSDEKLMNLVSTQVKKTFTGKDFDYQFFARQKWQDKTNYLLQNFSGKYKELLAAISIHLEMGIADLLTTEPTDNKAVKNYFVNRVDELNQLMRLSSKTYIIESPASYGKTTLLRNKLKEEVEEEKDAIGYFYFDLKSERVDSITSFNNVIQRTFNQSRENLHIYLGEKNYLKIYLIFDHFEHFIKYLQSQPAHEEDFNRFIDDFIINNGGLTDRKFFIILSGRKVQIKSTEFRKYLDRSFRLTDFTVETIDEAIKISINSLGRKLNEMKIKQKFEEIHKNTFANEIYCQTGGHPYIIRRILENYETSHYPLANISLNQISIKDYRDEEIKKIIENTELFTNLSFSFCKSLFQTISVFRIFDPGLIKKLLEKKVLEWNFSVQESSNSVSYKIWNYLIKSNLFQEIHINFRGNSIIRRLFLYSLVNDDKQRFSAVNKFALETYEEFIKNEINESKSRLNAEVTLFICEYIYHSVLPLKINKADDTKKMKQLQMISKKLKEIQNSITLKFPEHRNRIEEIGNSLTNSDISLDNLLNEIYGERSFSLFKWK